ncbi:MAG TPA: nucleotidyltransferase domain-containing protein [Promineifilum sp.]
MTHLTRDLDEVGPLIARTVLAHFPDTQGIYLFGSFGTADIRSDSDVDIALLLPPETAKQAGALWMSDLHRELSVLLGRDVDLLNARQVSTVFQKAIIYGDLIFCGDRYAVDEFEMLTLSYYQKLNEERAEILEAFRQSGRAFDV